MLHVEFFKWFFRWANWIPWSVLLFYVSIFFFLPNSIPVVFNFALIYMTMLFTMFQLRRTHDKIAELGDAIQSLGQLLDN